MKDLNCIENLNNLNFQDWKKNNNEEIIEDDGSDNDFNDMEFSNAPIDFNLFENNNFFDFDKNICNNNLENKEFKFENIEIKAEKENSQNKQISIKNIKETKNYFKRKFSEALIIKNKRENINFNKIKNFINNKINIFNKHIDPLETKNLKNILKKKDLNNSSIKFQAKIQNKTNIRRNSLININLNIYNNIENYKGNNKYLNIELNNSSNSEIDNEFVKTLKDIKFEPQIINNNITSVNKINDTSVENLVINSNKINYFEEEFNSNVNFSKNEAKQSFDMEFLSSYNFFRNDNHVDTKTDKINILSVLDINSNNNELNDDFNKEYEFNIMVYKSLYRNLIKAENKLDGIMYLILIINTDNLSKKIKEKILLRIKYLSILNNFFESKHYLNLVFTWEESKFLFVKYDNVLGNLNDLLVKNRLIFDEKECKKLMKHTIKGLLDYNKLKLSFLMLNPINIYLGDDYNYKISEINMLLNYESAIYNEFKRYIAPELLLNVGSNSPIDYIKCDIYSIGVIIYDIICHNSFKYNNIVINENDKNKLHLNKNNYSSTFNFFIKRMIDSCPQNRPSIEEIRNFINLENFPKNKNKKFNNLYLDFIDTKSLN